MSPAGWAQTTLGRVRADRSAGVNPSKTPEERFELYSVPAHPTGVPEVVAGRQIGSNKQTVEAGTVLLCKINPRINRVWVVGSHSPWTKIASTEWIPFFPIDGVDPRYLAYFLRRDEFRTFLASNVSGVGGSLMRVRPATVQEVTVPLAPLVEQRRIVAAIEQQLSRVEAGVEALARVKKELARYRASVLKAACEGRLVPTEAALARAEGRDYEPASALLARILTERRARWDRTKKYAEPTPPGTSDLQVLPEGWVWTTLGTPFDVCVGATPSRSEKDYWGGKIAWVSSGEVAFCRIKSTRETITAAGLKNSSTKLHPPGTVLLGMIGEGKTRGQAAVLDIAACNNQNSAAIRVSDAGLSPEYIYSYLESVYEVTRRVGGGNNQPALNKSRVEQLRFALPPLAEQHRIVAEVERRLSIADEVAASVDSALARAARLRQSILKRAFEGKLVPQDPNDEPASVLLARIRGERESAASAKSKQRAKGGAR